MSDPSIPNGQPWLPLCSPWADVAAMRGEDDSGCVPCSVITDAVSDEMIEAALLQASEFLYAASRYLFPGGCTAVARPCPDEEWWWSGIFAWAPIPWFFPAGVFPPWWGGGCWCGAGGAGCCGPPATALGHIPLVSVEEVKIDGVVLDPDEYAITYGGMLLSRLDPDDPTAERQWPRYQRLDLPDTEAGTWSVSYTYGAAVPALGERAAIDLACELLKSICGGACDDQAAQLARVTRGGVTKELINPTGEIRSLMPPSVKMFLDAYNPGDYRTLPRMRRPQPAGYVTSRLWPTDQIGRAGWNSGCIGCG